MELDGSVTGRKQRDSQEDNLLLGSKILQDSVNQMINILSALELVGEVGDTLMLRIFVVDGLNHTRLDL